MKPIFAVKMRRHRRMKQKTIVRRIGNYLIYPIRDNPGQKEEITDCAIRIAQRTLAMRDPAAKRLSGRAGIDDNTSAKRELRLFIDSNGGKRESIIIQIGILRALQEQGVGAKAILYADYNPGSERWKKPVKVYDKQAEYEIFDIVSGIDEFVEYGRVGKLRQYFEHSQSGICKVLDCIQNMCDAFTTCFANPMVESVAEAARALQAFLYPEEAQCSGILPESKIEPDELERYVISQICNDLGEEMMTCALNSGSGASLAILPMIRWCYRKQFYQQAATLYVEKMPEWYTAIGIVREELGWIEADTFYEKAYTNRFEVNYKSRLCALLPRRAAALSGLDCLCWDAGLRLDRRIVEQSRAYIEGHYDKGGSVNAGQSSAQPLRDYVKSLENINGIFCDIKDNHDLNMRKNRLEQKVDQFLPAAQHSQQVTRSAVTNMLNSLKNSQGNYRMDSGQLNLLIQEVQNNYEGNGDRKFGVTDGPKKLKDYVASKEKEYTKRSQAYVQYIAAHPECVDTIGKDNIAYLRKMFAIQSHNNDYADIIMGSGWKQASHNTESGMDVSAADARKNDLTQLLMYYLAFKIIRNNSNHANGEDNQYAKEVCLWLRDHGVLKFDDDMLTQDKIRFNHLIIRDLINGAIVFNDQWEMD